jgi:Transposase DDE domain group 1
MFQAKGGDGFSMTECIQSRLAFASEGKREVVAEFNGGTISSDGGALLLRETDQRIDLLGRFSQCFLDGRNPVLIEHRIEQMLAQRVYGLALGYEDLNDHEQLRHDPLLGVLAGKAEPGKEALAGKSTLNRMELGDGTPNRYKKITFWRDAIDDLLVDVFLEAHRAAPEQVVLDIDTTDFAIHGEQEGRFYHGYYDHYCYLPLYVFAGEHVLCARLRPSNIDPSAGSRKEIERIIRQLRAAWPGVPILLRGDSGFCREELMAWCENHQVDYVFGLARNVRLEAIVAEALQEARRQWEQTQQPARVFTEFQHATVSGTWSRKRRVVVKAEHIDGKSNPRFIVTSLPAESWAARP